MAGSLDQRMMDAEADANKFISEKDYQHTAAYARLAGTGERAVGAVNGVSLHDQLMKRAQVKQAMQNDGYQSSLLGANGFRQQKFNEADEETRKRMLSKQAKDRREDTIKKRLNQRTSARRGMQADDGTTPTSSKDTQHKSHTPDFTPETKPTIERHSFQEPTKQRYNPYS